jgi:hypothetical protein
MMETMNDCLKMSKKKGVNLQQYAGETENVNTSGAN